jgi:hypothetical protein
MHTGLIVYVLSYDDASEQRAHKLFEHDPCVRFLRLGVNKYCESQAYDVLAQKEHEWRDAAFVGTLAYGADTKITIPDWLALHNKLEHTEVDIIGLLPFGTHLVTQATNHHPLFPAIWQRLLAKMGYTWRDIFDVETPVFLCNYWLARPQWMRRFIEFSKRARHMLDNDHLLIDMSMQDACYRNHFSKDMCLQAFGRPYITYHPFVCERLPCTYFYVKGAAIALVRAGGQAIEIQQRGSSPRTV